MVVGEPIFDASGALAYEYAPSGTSVQHLYDLAARPLATVDLGLRTTLSLDFAGQVLATTSPIGTIITRRGTR